MSSPAFRASGTARSSLDRVYRALEEQGHRPKFQRGTHIQAHCPVHEDRTPSLSIDWNSDRGGWTLLKCHGCAADERDILEAIGLGLTDRFDEPLPARPSGPIRRRSSAPAANRLGPLPKRLTITAPAAELLTPWQQVRTYDYVDEAGELLGQVVRLERLDQSGTRQKTFRQRRPDGQGGWEKEAPARRVMRHLPTVISAIADGLPVWVAEGEKDDEALNAVLRPESGSPLGVATTNNNGAGGFADEQLEQLRGAHVVLVVDRDTAGYRRAVDLSNRLTDIAVGTRIVLAAVTDRKADAADHLAAGHALDEFVELSLDHARTLVAAAEVVDQANNADRSAMHTQTALDEARARRELATAATARGAAQLAKDETRFAQRWAHDASRHAKAAGSAAYEAHQLATAVTQQLTEHGQPPAELTGFLDAVPRAEEAQARAQRLAQEAWDVGGAPMPEAIRDVLLRAAPSFTPAPEPDEPAAHPDSTVLPFPGGGGGSRRPGSPVRWTEYDRLPTGVIIERRSDRDGREQLIGILSLDARVLQVECLENEPADDVDAAAVVAPVPEEKRIVSFVIGYTHPATGELITMRVAADRARSGDWLAELPEMGLDYDSSSKGRAKVWDAIRKTSAGAEVVTMYRSTGWREIPGHGWAYIHAGGGITNVGSIPLPVQLPGTLSRVELPTPVTDGAAIRQLFDQTSRALMSKLLPHVGAVLAGTAYRAVLGWTGPTTMMFGAPGTYKSAVSTLTMHHFGARWERALPTASMSGQGDTLNALREELWFAKDCLFFGDDFAPDKSIEAAATFLAQVARMQFNREHRNRYDARNDTVKLGRGTRCTLMLSSEVKASSGSGQERLNVIDLAKGQLDLSNILELDEVNSRRGRATVMASMLSWMAGDLVNIRQWAKDRVKVASLRRREEGAVDRVSEALAELEIGWELMARFLTAAGAYTQAEADAMLTEVRVALTDAGIRAIDPDSPSSVGERCRQLIASALQAGAIHVTLPGGMTPEYPEALQLGYRRVIVGMDHHSGEEITRLEPRGEKVGVSATSVHGWRIHAEPGAMLSALLTAARREQEPLQAGRAVIQRELAESGLLRTLQTPQGKRYQCPVPSVHGVPGKQSRVWDLDAEAIFALDPPAPPTHHQPTDPVGPDPYPGDDMRSLTDSTTHSTGDLGPCSMCGELTSLYVDGVRAHLVCWKAGNDTSNNTEPAPTPVADVTPHPDTAAATEPENRSTPPTQAVDPPPPAPAVTKATPARRASAGARGRRENPWQYSVAVIDPTGIYLPDGTVAAPEQIHTIADVAAVGDQFGIGHVAGAGLVVLTSAMVAQLGLLPDEALLTAPLDAGEPATDDIVAKRINTFLADQQTFLSNDQGWTADGTLGPWTRIRKDGRTLRLVLEPFAWVWDRRADSTSPFMELPDAEVDPAACWQELARRLDRLAQLLGIPWSTSPGATGEAIVDQIQRTRQRSGGRVLTAAGTLPELTPTHQVRLEGEFAFRRRPGKKELQDAVVVQKYDKRGSYLATAGGANLGYGDPAHLEADAAISAVTAARTAKSKMPFGVWLITLPAWAGPMPAPHPEQRAAETVTRWITTATLILLLDDEDAGGAGYDLSELSLAEAWVWPDQARFLEPWYTRCRDALLSAREDGDDAVARAIKGLYTGYVGRMASQYTARGARPWHHQPAWEATIRALARGSLWRAMQKHHLSTGRIPAAIDHDEVGYYDTEADPRINPPAADNGRLGALKSSGTVVLTDKIRKQLAQGGSVLDKRYDHPDDDAPAADGN